MNLCWGCLFQHGIYKHVHTLSNEMDRNKNWCWPHYARDSLCNGKEDSVY